VLGGVLVLVALLLVVLLLELLELLEELALVDELELVEVLVAGIVVDVITMTGGATRRRTRGRVLVVADDFDADTPTGTLRVAAGSGAPLATVRCAGAGGEVTSARVLPETAPRTTAATTIDHRPVWINDMDRTPRCKSLSMIGDLSPRYHSLFRKKVATTQGSGGSLLIG